MPAIDDLKQQSDDQLQQQLGDLKREQFNLRFQAATNQLEKPSRVREVRRTIARIRTLQGQRSPRRQHGAGLRRQGMPKRVLTGTVVSDKGDKTIVVRVERRVKHPLYGKIIKLSKKYHAHDADNAFHTGEIVRIEECAPVSKLKTWTVVDRLGTAKAAAVEIADPETTRSDQGARSRAGEARQGAARGKSKAKAEDVAEADA